MPDIHIEREHGLGLPAARALAAEWAEQAERRFDLQCRYESCGHEADQNLADTLSFQRSGVSGTLSVTAQRFVLDAKLGFLFGAFKDRIEAEIGKNLDALLKGRPPAAGC